VFIKEIARYYDSTVERETRPDLELAIAHVGSPKVAVDCGCGAGSDIAFLRKNGFTVHAFDIETESISRCSQRFGGEPSVHLSQTNFAHFDYPRANLIVADASLFFCPSSDFDEAWIKIVQALYGDGIFVGSFLGPEDTMAGPERDKVAFWPDVLVVSEDQVRSLFSEFEIISFTEHKTSGTTPHGTPCDWHIFSVVAKKN
jgi:SAM-dependent methyltransferase